MGLNDFIPTVQNLDEMDKSLGKHKLLKSTEREVENLKKLTREKQKGLSKTYAYKRHQIQVGL